MDVVNIVTHALSGLLLLMVGVLRLSNPVKNYAKNSGINLDKDVNLLNEMRGVGAVMLLGGIIILLGIAVAELEIISFIVAILLFLGFALGRIVSIGADGKPNKMIIRGLAFELVFGLLNIFCLYMVLV